MNSKLEYLDELIDSAVKNKYSYKAADYFRRVAYALDLYSECPFYTKQYIEENVNKLYRELSHDNTK